MEFIYEKDLKSVKFQQSTSSSTNHTLHDASGDHTKPGMPKLTENENYTFQALYVSKGRVSPSYTSLLNSSANNKKGIGSPLLVDQIQRLQDAIPSEESTLSPFCRISYRPIGKLYENLHIERSQLLVQRTQCCNPNLIAMGEVDSEMLPYVEDGLDMINKKEKELNDLLLHVYQCRNRHEAIKLCENVMIQSEPSPQLHSTSTKVEEEKPALPTTSKAASSARIGSTKNSIMEDSFFNGEDEYDLQLAMAMSASLQASDSPQIASSKNQNITKESAENPVGPQLLFQCSKGAFIFLHPMNTQCLNQHFSSSATPVPSNITGRVIEIEQLRLGGEASKGSSRYNFLKHLPLYTEVYIVEIDLRPLVSKQVLEQYKEEIQRRINKRKERKKVEIREKKIEEQKR